ncbi:hypothetical protein [Pseudoalteromonas luteoviolacea]|uniref:hypothetical protein n=1 Tax=Pseudoalteromonas luteoviolacea TaxID=43657 RepID=UPI001B369F47|nr:hypothetical protein [Pseudoalteromonas luteoviolacea]MBQ4836611.1 hypothetical protein [Pseudoalteromonas luteoviolacea]
MNYKSIILSCYHWVSVAFSLLLYAPSLVPGAMSILAYYISLFVLLLSIITIKYGGRWCFKSTAVIVGLGIFIVNDYLRLVGSLPSSTWVGKLVMYGVFTVITTIGIRKCNHLVGTK